MIQKESYGYNTFATTRIGEIQEGTNPQDWYWVESDKNIADWITRGKRPSSIACCFHELTPSTPMHFQDRISPYNINTV